MGMNIKEVLDNRTSDEWVELLDRNEEEYGEVINDLLEDSNRLTKMNKVMGVSVVGLALALAVSTSIAIISGNKKGGKDEE